MSLEPFTSKNVFNDKSIAIFYQNAKPTVEQEFINSIKDFYNKLSDTEKLEIIENIDRVTSKIVLIQDIVWTTKILRENKDKINELCECSRYYFKRYLNKRDKLFALQREEKVKELRKELDGFTK